jgi:hypothetical protein
MTPEEKLAKLRSIVHRMAEIIVSMNELQIELIELRKEVVGN